MSDLLFLFVCFLIGFSITALPGIIRYWTWKREFKKRREAYRRSIQLYLKLTERLGESFYKELDEAQKAAIVKTRQLGMTKTHAQQMGLDIDE